MNQKYSQNIYHVNVNVTLMVENVTQIKSEVTIKAGVSAKSKRMHCVPKKLYLDSCYIQLMIH